MGRYCARAARAEKKIVLSVASRPDFRLPRYASLHIFSPRYENLFCSRSVQLKEVLKRAACVLGRVRVKSAQMGRLGRRGGLSSSAALTLTCAHVPAANSCRAHEEHRTSGALSCSGAAQGDWKPVHPKRDAWARAWRPACEHEQASLAGLSSPRWRKSYRV